ncbi:hypothetical protein EGT67_14610 [Prescottella agglutinans]|uniref:Uncharacterized protein n=1 Tax=Prescottella agglutinans TaxID=1644129 RepID=A0A438BCP6_9NOCA|nr:hypothetical protein EGT67_14610 [Prescottella agglutinans]
MFRFRRSGRSDAVSSPYDPRDLLWAYERHVTRAVRPSGELLIEIPLRDAGTLEVTVPDPSADWIDSRVRGLCATLGALDRRAQRILRGEFRIGWIELDSADHGTVDYWAIGVNSEYAVDISWTGDGWEESAPEPD